MNPELTNQLDRQISQALNHAPQIAIPTDFAARVARQMPEPLAISTRERPSYARRFAVLSAVLLSLSLVVMAVQMSSTVVIAIEWFLSIELAAVTVWLGLRRMA